MHCSAVKYGYWDRSFSGSQKKIGLDDFQDGDSDAKMVYKVCHASFPKSAHPLVEYFQRTSSWHQLKKSVA